MQQLSELLAVSASLDELVSRFDGQNKGFELIVQLCAKDIKKASVHDCISWAEALSFLAETDLDQRRGFIVQKIADTLMAIGIKNS